MILHREERQLPVAHPLDGPIVEVDVGQLNLRQVEALGIDRKTLYRKLGEIEGKTPA